MNCQNIYNNVGNIQFRATTHSNEKQKHRLCNENIAEITSIYNLNNKKLASCKRQNNQIKNYERIQREKGRKNKIK